MNIRGSRNHEQAGRSTEGLTGSVSNIKPPAYEMPDRRSLLASDKVDLNAQGGLSESSVLQGSPSFLELHAPEQLNEGQELFGQEPFEKIIQDTGSRFGINEQCLKIALLRIGGIRSNSAWQELLEMAPEELMQWAQSGTNRGINDPAFTNAFIGGCNVPREKARDFKIAATTMIGQIAVWPYSLKYISTQLSSLAELSKAYKYASYTIDGMPKHNPLAVDTPPLSYAQWALQELMQDEAIADAAVKDALREAFPQDFGVKDIDTITQESGKSRPHRRYLLTKAAEIPHYGEK